MTFLFVDLVVTLDGRILITLKLYSKESLEFLLEHNLLGHTEWSSHVAEFFFTKELICRLDSHLLRGFHSANVTAVGSFENRVDNKVVYIDKNVLFVTFFIFYLSNTEVNATFKGRVVSKSAFAGYRSAHIDRAVISAFLLEFWDNAHFGSNYKVVTVFEHEAEGVVANIFDHGVTADFDIESAGVHFERLLDHLLLLRDDTWVCVRNLLLGLA